MGDILSTVGNILSTVGDILSTVGDFSTLGINVGGYLENILSTVEDILSTVGPSVPWGHHDKCGEYQYRCSVPLFGTVVQDIMSTVEMSFVPWGILSILE